MSKTDSAAPKAPAAAAAPATPNGAPENKGGGHKAPTMVAPSKHNVTALPGMCFADGCKKRSEKANFCMEHFDWFKEGLITKEGRKPSDFEKKHFDYTRRLAKKKSA
jgi:hypothetical protein